MLKAPSGDGGNSSASPCLAECSDEGSGEPVVLPRGDEAPLAEAWPLLHVWLGEGEPRSCDRCRAASRSFATFSRAEAGLARLCGGETATARDGRRGEGSLLGKAMCSSSTTDESLDDSLAAIILRRVSTGRGDLALAFAMPSVTQ